MDVFDTFMESLNPRQSELETKDVIMAGGGCAKPEGADPTVDEAAQKVQQEPNPIHTSIENMDMLAEPSEYSFLETSRSDVFENEFEMIPNFRSFQQKGIVGDGNNEENMDILDVSLECSFLETSRSNALGDGFEPTMNVNSVEQKEITGVENNEENMDYFLDESLEYSFLDSSRSNALGDGFGTTLIVKSVEQKEINGEENNQENLDFLDQSLEYSFTETSRSNAHKDGPDTLNVMCVEQQGIMTGENFERTSAETMMPVSVSLGHETSRFSAHRDVPEIQNVECVEQKQVMEVEIFERILAETSKPVSEFSGPETLRSDAHGDVPETSNVECAEQMEITGDENFETTELSGLETLRPDALGDVLKIPNVECVEQKEITEDENFKRISAETSKPASELSGLETLRSDVLGDGPETLNVVCAEQKEMTQDENIESTSVDTRAPVSEISGLATSRSNPHGDVPETQNVDCVERDGITVNENHERTSRLENAEDLCKDAALHSDGKYLSLVQYDGASKTLSEDAVSIVLTTDYQGTSPPDVTENHVIKQSEPVQTETVKIAADVGIVKTMPVQSKKRKSMLVFPENTRVLRSRSQEKAKLPEPKAVKIEDGANETRKVRRERKKEMKNHPVNEFSRIRKQLRYLLHRINFEQSLIDAYSGEGWKRQSVEKIKPEKELQRARSQIFSSKLKIRDLFQCLDASLNEGKIPETLFDSEGEIDSDDIFCAKCGNMDVTLDNDIILCDGACDRAFHQFCLDPPLLKEDIPLGDEGWLCPGCDCKDDCFDILNDFLGSRLTILDNWEKVFPEEAAAKASGKNMDDMSILQSDDEDDDYNPNDHPLNNESSGKSEYVSASDVKVPDQNDEAILGLPSDDSEDDDFDPIDPPSENDHPGEHGSSSSDFTSDSEDLGAILEDKEDEGCVSSKSNSTKFEASVDEEKLTVGKVKGQSLNNELSYILNSDATPISGKRNVERLDYKMLHDETYGDTASDSSDDEFEEKTSRKRRKDGDDIATPESGRCKRSKKCHTDDPRVGNDRHTSSESQGPKNACGSDDQGPKNACVKEEKSYGVGLSGNKNKKLGEAATQRLLESFNENQYPKKDDKDSLADELGLRVQQVSKWFENARWSFRHTYRMESKIAKISGKNVTEPSASKLTESTPPPKLKPGTESTPPPPPPPPPSGNGVKETKRIQSSPEKVKSEGTIPNSNNLRCNKNSNNNNGIAITTNQEKTVVDTQTGRRKSSRLNKISSS